MTETQILETIEDFARGGPELPDSMRYSCMWPMDFY